MDTPRIQPRRQIPPGSSIAMEVRVAHRQSEVVQCQYLIADVYNSHYGIVFSRQGADLQAKIEPYPEHYVMGFIDDRLVAAAGLYVRSTYVEKWGGISDHDIRQELDRANIRDPLQGFSTREYTKLVVHRDYYGHGIGRLFFAVSHSMDFINIDGVDRPLLVCCAKRSVYENLYDVSHIATRILKPFPRYRVHERYASEADPMDSRLIVPEIDIHPRWYKGRLPARVEVENLRKWQP